ncbi:MAG: helix-turn-helix domain-containing protein [Candidatus Bathyarchaeia archaeon]|jgi:DNA-binding transcriptional ArsR family regulator
MERKDVETKQLLERILSVLKLANTQAIQDEKEAILKGPAKRKVYELCDGKNTVNEIATKSRLSQPNVSQHLASLMESGLVLYDEIGGKKYYFKSLE